MGGHHGVQVAAFDWQFCCRARGAYDLAYFLALALPPDVRAEHEEQLKAEYIASLREAAGPGVGAAHVEEMLAELEVNLRQSLLLIMASFVMGASKAPESSEAMHLASLLRLAVTAASWNAPAIFPGLETACLHRGNFAATPAL